MIEKTFAMVKPDAVDGGNVGHVIARLETEGFRMVEMRQRQLDPVEVGELLAAGTGIAGGMGAASDELRSFLCSGPSVLLLLEREDAVAYLCDVVGPEDSRMAAYCWHLAEGRSVGDEASCARCGDVVWCGSRPPSWRRKVGSKLPLRALYGDARDGAPMYRNAVHASASRADADVEIDFFFGRSPAERRIDAFLKRMGVDPDAPPSEPAELDPEILDMLFPEHDDVPDVGDGGAVGVGARAGEPR